jgi:MFS family permease
MKIQNSHSYRKVAVAACFGTFLEWYDFLTFATLAVIFAPLFFPSTDPNTALLASLATFGVGMVVRPIGAALFGSMGDRIGRKPVFMLKQAFGPPSCWSAYAYSKDYLQAGRLAGALSTSLNTQAMNAGDLRQAFYS